MPDPQPVIRMQCLIRRTLRKLLDR